MNETCDRYGPAVRAACWAMYALRASPLAWLLLL